MYYILQNQLLLKKKKNHNNVSNIHNSRKKKKMFYNHITLIKNYVIDERVIITKGKEGVINHITLTKTEAGTLFIPTTSLWSLPSLPAPRRRQYTHRSLVNILYAESLNYSTAVYCWNSLYCFLYEIAAVSRFSYLVYNWDWLSLQLCMNVAKYGFGR